MVFFFAKVKFLFSSYYVYIVRCFGQSGGCSSLEGAMELKYVLPLRCAFAFFAKLNFLDSCRKPWTLVRGFDQNCGCYHGEFDL